MKVIKEHKIMVIVIVLFILLVIVASSVYTLLVPSNGKPIYGDRLDGKDAVAVSQETYEQVKQKLKEDTIVSNVEIDERGRLINVIVTVTADTILDAAKALAPRVLESFTDAQKGYFDFQVLIRKEDESKTDFPIIGYRHHDRQDFTWTKDRVSE